MSINFEIDIFNVVFELNEKYIIDSTYFMCDNLKKCTANKHLSI